MNNKKSPTQLALSLFPILGLSSAAHGATIVQNFTIQPTGVIVEAFSSSASIAPYEFFRFNVDQFDPSLGTLNSVQLIFDLNIQGIAGAGDSGGTINADIGYVYRTNDAGFWGDGGGGVAHGAPGATIILDAGQTENRIFQITDGDVSVATISGTGTFELSVEGSGSLNASGIDSDGVVLNHNGGTLSWIYDYTPVPEPGSLALLLGACGLFVFRRRM